jgi:ferrochelatase
MEKNTVSSMTQTSVTLLVNLGSPRSTSLKDIRLYLGEFLMDKYVIDLPWLFRAALVYGPILTFRPKKTAHAYQEIWTKGGSPLIQISKGLQKKVQRRVDSPVYLAMRYGQPSIFDTLSQIREKHPSLTSLFVVPLYPQYAMSTTLTVEKEILSSLQRLRMSLTPIFKPPFYKDSDYIQALAKGAKKQLISPEHLLFSYHGLPERHLRKTDPTRSHCTRSNCCERPSQAWDTCYKHQCYVTTRSLMETLNMDLPYSVGFQSRLGPDKWLSPSTEDTAIQLAKSGVKHLHVMCPSFVSDCLETLEEVNMGIRDSFLENGGEKFTYIPCLNTQDSWVDVVSEWIQSRSLS